MKILKLKLFQETACYKKPYAFKVGETYPLPPYSTIIGMLHNILEAKSGQVYPFQISIQGDYEHLFNNYIHYRKYLTSSEKKYYGNSDFIHKPLNCMMLLNVNLILHIKSSNEVIDKIYSNITQNGKAIALGRNEDIARLDYINFVTEERTVKQTSLKNNAYISPAQSKYGITYRLNTYYTISKNNLRKFDTVEVKYAEEDTPITNCVYDNEKDAIFFTF